MTRTLLLLALLLAPEAVRAEEWTGNAGVFLGGKRLRDDDWKPVRNQGEGGFRFDFREKSWPVNIAIDVLGGTATEIIDFFGSDVLVRSRTSEFDLGVRKIWEGYPHVRPFIGGGLALVRGSLEAESSTNRTQSSDRGAGLWFGCGVYWTLGGAFNIGFEARRSRAEIELRGNEVNAGGRHFGLLLGYHW